MSCFRAAFEMLKQILDVCITGISGSRVFDIHEARSVPVEYFLDTL